VKPKIKLIVYSEGEITLELSAGDYDYRMHCWHDDEMIFVSVYDGEFASQGFRFCTAACDDWEMMGAILRVFRDHASPAQICPCCVTAICGDIAVAQRRMA